MKDEFVMVPRDWAESIISAGRGEPVSRTDLDTLRAAIAEQHQGEPVAYTTNSGRSLYFPSPSIEVMPGDRPLYAHADPAEVGEIKKHIAELLGEVDTLTAEVERLRAENQSLRKTLPSSTTELVDLRAQLAETHALLRMVYLDEGTTDEKCARVEQIISASAERNQCDGCQAGIPVVNGAHRMGKPGVYSDSMSCQALKYASAEPSAPKCEMCGQGARACNEGGCHYLESGNGAPVEHDERADFEADVNKQYPGTLLALSASKARPGQYANLYVQSAWNGWQARAALERKP